MERVLRAEALIIGAGPSGAALAALLGQQGWDCLLMDRARFPRRKPCAGCFSSQSFPLLKRLGLDQVIRTGQRIRFVNVQIPGRSLCFDTDRDPQGPLFYVFPRETFDHLLLEKARSCSVRVLEGVRAESLLRGERGVEGVLAGGREIRAGVTVVATGAASRFLPQECRRSMRGYQALIGWFEDLADPDPLTTDSFTAPWLIGSGWIFPESETRANVGIMVHEDRLRSTRGNLRRLFDAYCETPFARQRLKGARRVGGLAGSPIRYSLRPRGICGDGFLMVGEANLLTHPLTGEGISQALRSASAAAEALEEARRGGAFDREALGGYSRRIQEMFQRNFRKAGLLRRWLDRPFPVDRVLAMVQCRAGMRVWLEERFHRIVL
jgi:menaquinone-9 beta-reductase